MESKQLSELISNLYFTVCVFAYNLSVRGCLCIHISLHHINWHSGWDCVIMSVLIRTFITLIPLLCHAPRSKRCFPFTLPHLWNRLRFLYFFLIIWCNHGLETWNSFHPFFFFLARDEHMVPIWAVVPSVYAPRGGEEREERMCGCCSGSQWETHGWGGGGDIFLIYVYMLLIKFWDKWHTFMHAFYFSLLSVQHGNIYCYVNAGFGRLDRFHCLEQLVPWVQCPRVCVCACVCWITGWTAFESHWAEQKNAAAHVGRGK